MTTDADRIAAEGVPIRTRRGELPLLYGFRALRALEDQYGSIIGMQDAMQAILDTMGDDGRGKAFGPLADIILPGLLHTGLSRDELEDALLPGEVKAYTEAMQDAMLQAFPEGDDTPASTGNDAGPPPAKGSRGPSGSTSARAGTGGQRKRSGR